MPEGGGIKRAIDELKRRKVFQVAVGYVVIAWVILQVAEITSEPLNLPEWSTGLVLWLLVLGFPVAVIMAWALEVTPDGIRRTRRKRKPPPRKSRPSQPVAAKASIAVLPFVDMSPDKDQDHFCEGMAEEIINALTKITGVHVASRTASFQFKGDTADIDHVGDQLGVDTVLEGSVRKEGDAIRVTAQLINVDDGFHIWSEGYDRELKGVFAIQKEIAESVVKAFRLTLDEEEEQAIVRQPTDNIEAYEYYLRGRRQFFMLNRHGWEQAREMFSRAIELDPDYALAYAGLADCFSFLYMYADSSASNRLQAETNSRLALQLAPDSAEAHASRGLALSHSKKYDDADVVFRRAVDIDPKLYDAYYFWGRNAFVQGRYEKAAELFESASRVRPEDYQAPALLAQVYRALGRESERAEARKRTLEAIEKRLETSPNDSRALCFGAMNLLEDGQRDRGMAWLQRAYDSDPEDALNLYNVACVHAQNGNTAEALDCLERSINMGMTQLDWIQHDSDLDPLREEPRFKALLPDN